MVATDTRVVNLSLGTLNLLDTPHVTCTLCCISDDRGLKPPSNYREYQVSFGKTDIKKKKTYKQYFPSNIINFSFLPLQPSLTL